MRLDEIDRRGFLKGVAGAAAGAVMGQAQAKTPGMIKGDRGQLSFWAKDNGNITMSNGAKGTVWRFSENWCDISMSNGEGGKIYMPSQNYGQITMGNSGLTGTVLMSTKENGTISMN